MTRSSLNPLVLYLSLNLLSGPWRGTWRSLVLSVLSCVLSLLPVLLSGPLMSGGLSDPSQLGPLSEWECTVHGLWWSLGYSVLVSLALLGHQDWRNALGISSQWPPTYKVMDGLVMAYDIQI